MKELSIEQKAKRYDEAFERVKELLSRCTDNRDRRTKVYRVEDIESIFPELKESEDERVRKAILALVRQSSEVLDKQNQNNMIAWLEKQGEFKSNKWTEGDVVRHGGVLALVINGRKAMKSNCEQITIQYPDEWVKTGKKERKYFFEELEKQGEQNLIMANSPQLGEQKPFDYEDVNIQQKDFAPKSAMEAAKEKKIDNANKVEPKDYNSIDPHFGKPADKA